jgi:hypothetical protein
MDRILGGLQSQSGCCGKEKNPPLAWIQIATIHLIIYCYTDRAIKTPYNIQNHNQKCSVFSDVISHILTLKTLQIKLKDLILAIRLHKAMNKTN